MRKLALVLVFLGFGCAAAALALKAFAPGEKGAVALSAGDTVELDGATLPLASNPTFHVRMKNPRISWGFA